MAKVFQIGKHEAAAVSNLRCHVSTEILQMVTESVRKRGMRSFVSHEMLGKDVLNLGFSSGKDKWEAWHSELTNAADNELVLWC